MDGKGQPLSGIRVVAVKTEPLKGHKGSKTRTNSQGSFRLKGLIPNSPYLIHPESDKWMAKARVRVVSGPRRTTGALPHHFVIRFVYLKNGVIRDSLLGLEWVLASGQTMSWLEAVSHVANLPLAGGRWRLPSLSELRSIYDESLESHIDTAFGIDRDWVWSSQVKDDTEAWFFSFENRFEGGHCKEWPLTRGRVLAVRAMKP